MAHSDLFEGLATHYDALMTHVDYDRWFHVTGVLAGLLPRGFAHVDAGCGTGVLLEHARRAGWRSIGVDISPSMLAVLRRSRGPLPCAVGDLRALPVRGVQLITCLFDSMNFLLEQEEVECALRQCVGALRDGGILYFDVVTERMMVDHFADQTWTETHGGLRTTWANHYDPVTRICETWVRVSTGAESSTRERAYDFGFLADAVKDAGLTLMAAFDVENWKAPTRRTCRIDFIAAKNPTLEFRRRLENSLAEMRRQRR
jgi:SAM-dependent methyltransferase